MRRFFQIDLAKTICIIWIVFVWHFNEILPIHCRFGNGQVYSVLCNVTRSILACFTFISGFCLSKYHFSTKSDVRLFYYKRFWRFYLLLVLATLLVVIHYYDFPSVSGYRSFFSTIFGLSVFTKKPILTLWYMSMLLLFYLLTPLIRYHNSFLITIVVAFFLYALFCSLYFTGHCDKRLLLYFPVYVLGLLAAKPLMSNLGIIKKLCSVPSFLILLLVYIALCFLGKRGLIWSYVYAFLGIWLILGSCYKFYADWMRGAVSFISYTSLCLYLFHRLLYPLVLFLFGKTLPNNEHYLPLLYIPFAIIIIVGISYLIQKGYDKVFSSKLII